MQPESRRQDARTVCPACGAGQPAVQFDRKSWARQFENSTDPRHTMADMMAADSRLAFDQMLLCGNCGTLFTDRVPPIEALNDFYMRYHGDDLPLSKVTRKLALEKRRIFMLKWLTHGRRFLDVGCNAGCAVEAARRNGFTATGIELNPEAVKLARQTFPDNRFLQSTLDDFTEGSVFDLIFCTEVLEHVPDPKTFLQLLARVLAPGGVLFLSTPDAGHFSVRRNLLGWDNVKPPEHLTLFTKEALRHAFKPLFQTPRFFPNRKPGIQLIARSL